MFTSIILPSLTVLLHSSFLACFIVFLVASFTRIAPFVSAVSRERSIAIKGVCHSCRAWSDEL